MFSAYFSGAYFPTGWGGSSEPALPGAITATLHGSGALVPSPVATGRLSASINGAGSLTGTLEAYIAVATHSSGSFQSKPSQQFGSSRVLPPAIVQDETKSGSYRAMGYGSHVLVQWVDGRPKLVPKAEEVSRPQEQAIVGSRGVFLGQEATAHGSGTRQKRIGARGRHSAEASWCFSRSRVEDPELEEMLQVLMEIA